MRPHIYKKYIECGCDVWFNGFISFCLWQPPKRNPETKRKLKRTGTSMIPDSTDDLVPGRSLGKIMYTGSDNAVRDYVFGEVAEVSSSSSVSTSNRSRWGCLYTQGSIFEHRLMYPDTGGSCPLCVRRYSVRTARRCLRAAISTQRLSPRLPRCRLSWKRNAGNNTIG